VVAIIAIAVVGLRLVSGSPSTRTVATGGPSTSAGQSFGPGGRGRGTTGTIASIDAGALTLTTPNGSTKVLTTATTTFTSTAAGSMANLKVGDNVAVQGTTTGLTVAAARITDSGTLAATAGGRGGFGGNAGTPPPGGPPPSDQGANGPPQGGAGGRPVVGTLSTLSGTTAAVKAADGTTYAVTTSPSTTVTLVTASSLAALRLGETVRVTGTTAEDGTVTASSVRAGVAPGGPPSP